MATDAYDALPYGGRAVPLTHPDHLYVAARRAGMTPAAPEACRVLELGCAEGANLVPMAFHLDGARFVGVDGSSVQIERGRDQAARLGLDNLELVHARIEELGPDLGEHDYVIVHGVFSWVSDAVRERLLSVVRGALAPGGVAYLSFNCAPGWALRGEIRRALLRRVEGVADPREQVALARELLSMIAASPARETPHGALLAEEARRALAHRDAYVFHEYLAEHNRAFYFGELEAMARAHGLVPFDELGTAADPRLESGLVRGLTETIGDRTRAEEITELLLLRAFRMMLLRRDDAPVGSPDVIGLAERLRYAASIRPEQKRISLEAGVHEGFVTRAGAVVQTSRPALKAALLELGKSWPNSLSLTELAERARLLLAMRRVIGADDELGAEDRGALGRDLVELSTLGHVLPRLRDVPPPTAPPERPRVSALTRAEAAVREEVTSPHHELAVLDPLMRKLVRHLDGTRGMDELVVLARGLVEAESLALTGADGAPIAEDALDEVLPEVVARGIADLAAHEMLI